MIEIIGWIGVVLSITGTVLLSVNIRWSRYAYFPMLAGCAAWLYPASVTHDMPQMALWTTYAVVNVIGIWRWIIKPQSKAEALEEQYHEMVHLALSLSGEIDGLVAERVLRTNDYRVEQKKRLRAEAALRAIAKKGDGAMTEIADIKKLATDTLDITP